MDPRTTTAVVTMRIWQLRGGAKSMTFLVSNCASSLICRAAARELATVIREACWTGSRPLRQL